MSWDHDQAIEVEVGGKSGIFELPLIIDEEEDVVTVILEMSNGVSLKLMKYIKLSDDYG